MGADIMGPDDLEQEAAMTTQERSMVDVASSRQAQEVQGAMVIAKKFPRDETTAINRILKSCKRKTLAEVACYSYPKGGTTVTGPSIRLAEAMAQNWGNIDFGIIELEQKRGESIMMAYAWDLETNTRQTKIFTVKHMRHTKKGDYKLTDPREIYEMTANQGARRLRACILGVIPGDVQDEAVLTCEKTLAGDNSEPLSDRVRKMVGAFGDLGISKDMIEKRLGHVLDVTSEQELVNLRKIYTSIKDNMASPADFFEVEPETDPKAQEIKDKIKAKTESKPKPEKKDKPENVCPEWQALQSAFANKETRPFVEEAIKEAEIKSFGEIAPDDDATCAGLLEAYEGKFAESKKK